MIEILLFAGAFAAGMLDAVVGGGGLIQIPLLFSALPQAPPGTVFGTNKVAAVFGTAAAAARYASRVPIPWRIALPAAGAAFVCAYAGALSVALLPRGVVRPLVLILLVAVAIYTFVRKDFGAAERPRVPGRADGALAACVGGILGFYDGFFGPGTGSFLIFLFVRLFGLDFLRASVAAKVVNVVTNVAALVFFASNGFVLWSVGLGMAGFNIAGSLVGSHLAIQRGARFVRRAFLVVTCLLITKFAWDTFLAGST
ncbi:MAG: TSUP family transporter [Rhodocyclaceae bacterium]